jgi:uncharacterized protein DUF6599
MTLANRIRIPALLAVLCAAAPLIAQRSGSTPAADPGQLKSGSAARRAGPPDARVARTAPLLPAEFAGWQRRDDRTGADPRQVDSANAELMKEFGFTDFELATYTRDGRQVQIRAARFADAGGAYGGFAFYAQPQMQKLEIGDQAVATQDAILFYRGNVLVNALFEQVTAMSAAALRELASALPSAPGPAADLPSLLGYLPRPQLTPNSTKYVVGQVGLALAGFPLTPAQARFDQGAELVVASYATDSGPADLMLVSYPTPQLAAERLRTLEADMAKQGAGAGIRMARRTGTIVVVVSGAASARDAKSLLTSVNYDANVTWDEPTFLGKRDNVGSLIVAALALCGIILLLALVAGIAFGGIRILMKRLYPDRVFDRSSDVEIIRLNIGR